MQNPETGEMRMLLKDDILDKAKDSFKNEVFAKKIGFPANSPIFCEGEVLQIRGGWWRIQKIWRGRMKLKSISRADAEKV